MTNWRLESLLINGDDVNITIQIEFISTNLKFFTCLQGYNLVVNSGTYVTISTNWDKIHVLPIKLVTTVVTGVQILQEAMFEAESPQTNVDQGIDGRLLASFLRTLRVRIVIPHSKSFHRNSWNKISFCCFVMVIAALTRLKGEIKTSWMPISIAAQRKDWIYKKPRVFLNLPLSLDYQSEKRDSRQHRQT